MSTRPSWRRDTGSNLTIPRNSRSNRWLGRAAGRRTILTARYVPRLFLASQTWPLLPLPISRMSWCSGTECALASGTSALVADDSGDKFKGSSIAHRGSTAALIAGIPLFLQSTHFLLNQLGNAVLREIDSSGAHAQCFGYPVHGPLPHDIKIEQLVLFFSDATFNRLKGGFEQIPSPFAFPFGCRRLAGQLGDFVRQAEVLIRKGRIALEHLGTFSQLVGNSPMGQSTQPALE